MADPRDREYNQEYQYGKDHHLRSEDFAACASVNANYYYQMSLWWWNTYMYNLHARSQSSVGQFADQNCECVERSVMMEGDCECCQNDGGMQTQRGQMNTCRDCPESPYGYGPSWQRLQGEYSESGGSHPGFIFREGDVPGKDNGDENYSCGDEDFDGHCDNENEDDDDDDYNNDGDDGGDNNDENSDVDVEVDDNFRKFLEQSERHRQEREQRKQELLKEKDDYIEVGSIHLNTTTSAPTEQPGAKRKEEMKILYGKHASSIMALEASLQLNYDKQCDARQPVFWPSIPLKF